MADRERDRHCVVAPSRKLDELCRELEALRLRPSRPLAGPMRSVLPDLLVIEIDRMMRQFSVSPTKNAVCCHVASVEFRLPNNTPSFGHVRRSSRSVQIDRDGELCTYVPEIIRALAREIVYSALILTAPQCFVVVGDVSLLCSISADIHGATLSFQASFRSGASLDPSDSLSTVDPLDAVRLSLIRRGVVSYALPYKYDESAVKSRFPAVQPVNRDAQGLMDTADVIGRWFVSLSPSDVVLAVSYHPDDGFSACATNEKLTWTQTGLDEFFRHMSFCPASLLRLREAFLAHA